ncbi:angiomotin-like [Oppia nitens]|uniref:angiomotin-like n=1 Tax=Oppia nitens TaxID=1686743 RepID=UPI0023DA147B|nr:angiomotin-like [Oppia nitens]
MNNKSKKINGNNSNAMQTVTTYLTPMGPKSTSNNSVKQSSSGSETDVSTSTSIENLTPEERYVLRNGVRQEPQGEEAFISATPLMDTISLNNTLIIHHNKSLDGLQYQSVSPLLYGQRINNNINDTNNNNSNNLNNSNNNNIINKGQSMTTITSQSASILSTNKSNSHINNVLIRTKSPPNLQLSPTRTSSCESVPSSPNAFNRALLQHFQLNNSGIENMSGLQQPMLTNYLNSLSNHWKNGNESLNNYDIFKHNLHLPPPPEYERQWSNSSPNSVSTSASNSTTPESKSVENLPTSRSHPDLTKFDEIALKETKCNNDMIPKYNMIEMLSAENAALKTELELYYKKVLKLQKFEIEIQKVHQSHEDLMRSSEKKEKLERVIRYKLEIDVRRLQDQNRDLKIQFESALSHISKRPISESLDDSELKKEIGKRDVLIAQLLSQNKELLNDKERQDIELQAQRLTLEEQRNHIDILDSALMSTQNNVIRLETECRKKQAYEERAVQLQKALSNLQLASDRRLTMEKRARNHLENEIDGLKKQLSGNKSGNKPENEFEDMKKVIRDYEEKIISLETEVTKWEQKYLEECTLRSIEVSAASAPKDAKIAALERTSQESEKLILEARSERLKHMDELHVANKKNAEFEGRVKDMESKLAEKDAMIKVLRQHSQDKDAVLHKTVLAQRMPNRHGRSASTMGLTSTTSSHSTQSSTQLSTIRSKREELTQSSCQTNETNSQNESNESNKMNLNLEEQLKQIDSRLTNKDSIIRALRSEKERYPNHYTNNWRL